jgi:hypothetical protein
MTMEHKTYRAATELVTHNVEAFPFVDAKGRRIGAAASITQETWAPLAADARSWSTLAPGTHFHVAVAATRDGMAYGASGNGQRFSTMPEAETYMAKYFRDAGKRAAKVRGAVARPL